MAVPTAPALVYPVYKRAFERSDPALTAIVGETDTHAYTEFLTRIVKDVRGEGRFS